MTESALVVERELWVRRPVALEPAPRAAVTLSGPSPSDAVNADEQVLVDAVCAGDSRAAALLYDRLRPTIEQSLARVLRSKPTDFEDLVQCTLERVVRGIAEGRFMGESQLKTWTYAIAGHVAKDWLRRSRVEGRFIESAEVGERATTTHPELQLEARSELRRIRRVLRRMKRLNATTLVLHDVYSHTVPEVAQMLDMSVSATESRLRRARAELTRRVSKSVMPGDANRV